MIPFAFFCLELQRVGKLCINIFCPLNCVSLFSTAVADNSTRHIQRLVDEQKRTGKISRIRKRPNELARRPPPKPAIPSTIRIKVKELMKSYEGGLEIGMFGTAYARRFGQEINYSRLNFLSLKKFLEACSDIVQIVETSENGINSITLHLNDELKGKRSATKKSIKHSASAPVMQTNARSYLPVKSASATTPNQPKIGNYLMLSTIILLPLFSISLLFKSQVH